MESHFSPVAPSNPLPNMKATATRRSAPAKDSAPPRPKRILIVDDHPVFRKGVAQIIAQEEDLTVCAEADGAVSALDAMRRLKPDIVLLDILLKGSNGIEIIKLMRAEEPRLPILMLSMHDEGVYALRALRAGASGYIMKAEAPANMIGAIRKVLAGDIYVSASMAQQLVRKAIHSDAGDGSALDALSDRELEVFSLIGRGFSTSEVASDLRLSIKTIETHRAHIREKLGIKTGGELVRFALEWVARENE